MKLILTLPYPPSVNHYKKVGGLVRTKTGKIYQKRVNSKETIGYYYQVYMRVKAAIGLIDAKSFGRATISVEVDVYPPDARKRDLDGILKVLLDSMQHAGVYDDDNQISRLTVQRMGKMDYGQVIVRIMEIV